MTSLFFFHTKLLLKRVYSKQKAFASKKEHDSAVVSAPASDAISPGFDPRARSFLGLNNLHQSQQQVCFLIQCILFQIRIITGGPICYEKNPLCSLKILLLRQNCSLLSCKTGSPAGNSQIPPTTANVKGKRDKITFELPPLKRASIHL